MKIAISTIGSRGDVQPYLALALRLRTMGYDVLFSAPSNFATWVQSFGLAFKAIGGDLQAQLIGNPDMLDVFNLEGKNPLKAIHSVREVYSPQLRQHLRDTIAACQGADLIVAGGFQLMGSSVAELMGVPHIFCSTAPNSVPSAYHPPAGRNMGRWMNWMAWNVYKVGSNQMLLGPINEVRREYGLRPLTELFHLITKSDAIFVPASAMLVQRPRDWSRRVHLTGYWFLDEPWTAPDALIHFLAAGSKPVYIGFGSMTQRDAQATTKLVVDAVERAGQRAVLISGWAGLGHMQLPRSIFKMESASHNWLFPHMAAVVHHGGAGTAAAGLRAGLPTLIVPHTADQPYWGRLIANLGLGPESIPRPELTAENLAQGIRQAISDPAIRKRTQIVARILESEDGTRRAIQILESFLRKPQRVQGTKYKVQSTNRTL